MHCLDPSSLLAFGSWQLIGTTGVAELVCATLQTESTVLESREVAEDVTLGDGRRRSWDISVLSETERIGTVQLVGSNSCVETRWCEGVLEDS